MRMPMWIALSVAVCTLLVAMPAWADPALSIDLNDRNNTTLTQSGFDVFLIDAEDGTPVTRTYGSLDVTLHIVGGNVYKDRLRTYPLNGGDFTESDILRDFVFADDSNGGGLNTKIAGLTPFGVYSGSIWSADGASNGPRMADWLVNGSVVANNYVHDGDDFSDVLPPPSNDTYRIDFTATASADGVLMIQGRHEKRSNGVSVMLNALQLTQTGTLQLGATPVASADFGSGSAMSGFTQVNLASASAGAVVDGKTITVAPVGKFSEISTATSYEVSINFWSDSADDWAVQAGLASDAMTVYDVTNSTNTGVTSSNRTLYTASLGTFTPAELATTSIYWDDVDPASSYERTWFDSFSLKRTDDDQVFYVEATHDNSIAEASFPSGQWYVEDDDTQSPLWNRRSGFGTFGAIMQSLKSDGDRYQVRTTLPDPAPSVPETPVTLSEADTGTVVGGAEFTQGELLSDYLVASNGDEGASGMDVLVEDLTPGGEYYVKLWAFDDAADESTRSDWYANGTLVNDGYRFDPDQDPMTNHEYSFGFIVTADENGEILIEGRVGVDRAEDVSDPNVYINALQIYDVIPSVTIPGDTNDDKKVDATDAATMADHWGQTIAGGSGVGDFNGDGMVNMLDASILAANWGDHNAESTGAVPEPSAMFMLAVGLVALAGCRRR